MPIIEKTIKTALSSILLIVVTLCCHSCGQRESTQGNNSGEATYELVKVDSLIIDEIEILQITDYNPSTKHFLAYGTNSQDCMEIDRDGNIVNRINLSGDGPGQYGYAMNGLSYFDQDIIINGFGKYAIYDAEWKFKRNLPSDNLTSPLRYMSENPKKIVYAGELRLMQLVDQNVGGHIQLEEGHFTTAKMIKLVSSNEESTQPILAYPENSIYVSNETYYSQHQPLLSFNAAENKLYLALPLESKLFVHNLDDSLSLHKTINLDFADFTAPQGIPFEDQFKNSLRGFGPANELNYVYMMSNSAILDMSSVGNVTMVKHKTGIKNKGITSYAEASNLAIKSSKTITSFIIDSKIVYDTEESIRYPVRIDEMQFIAPYLNDEVEVDYNKFYIYELQKTK